MNTPPFAVNDPLRLAKFAGFGLKTLAPLASVALLLTACGGGSGSGSGSAGGGTQPASTPLLQIGMQRLYSGTTTRSIVYATPTATQQNNTLVYNFTEATNVLQAPAGTGASFDVQSVYHYMITQDPGTGSVPVSQTVDAYENLVTNGTTQATSTLGQAVTTIQSDESANALGSGPYTATTVAQYSYPTPIPGATFPLQSGASFAIPLGEVVNSTYTDVNAGGSAPSNGSNVGYTSKQTKNNDGSLSTLTNRVNGVTVSTIINSDGSASLSSSGGATAYVATLGLPVQANGAFTIPVNYTFSAPTSSSTNYAAADWYPGNGAPPAPLANETKTVIGPVTSLPAACSGALVQPNMVEVDTNETSLSTTGSYLVSATRAFNANGAVVCSLQQQTSTSYNLQTGALFETTTTQTTSMLTGLTQ